MLILLEYNSINLDFEEDELVDLGLEIASSQGDLEDIKEWIKKHKTTQKQ